MVEFSDDGDEDVQDHGAAFAQAMEVFGNMDDDDARSQGSMLLGDEHDDHDVVASPQASAPVKMSPLVAMPPPKSPFLVGLVQQQRQLQVPALSPVSAAVVSAKTSSLAAMPPPRSPFLVGLLQRVPPVSSPVSAAVASATSLGRRRLVFLDDEDGANDDKSGPPESVVAGASLVAIGEGGHQDDGWDPPFGGEVPEVEEPKKVKKKNPARCKRAKGKGRSRRLSTTKDGKRSDKRAKAKKRMRLEGELGA